MLSASKQCHSVDLRPFGHGEAELAERGEDALTRAAERVGRAGGDVGRGQRGVGRGAERGGDLGVLHLGEEGGEQFLDLALGLVEQTADDRTLLLGERAHALHDLGEGAVGAHHAGLEGLHLGTGRDGGGVLPGGVDDAGELLLHA